MQQEFYIGQKVKTSQIGIENGCSNMTGTITREGEWLDSIAYHVAKDGDSHFDDGLFLPDEIEPIEDSSTPELVFDNIAKSL